MSGYVAYEGPSRIDSKPIVVIVTGVGTTKSEQSRNEKTGPLVQVWYLRSDISPIQAASSGEDRSICGDCKLRGHIEETEDGPRNRMRSCYVEIKNAPRSIWQSYRDGKYEPLTDDIQWPTQKTRLGSYGDPSSASYAINKDLISRGKQDKHTGYTSQWKIRKFQPMRKLVMASVRSEEERVEAQSKGWRTFRTMAEGEELSKGELMCPASEAEGKRLTCDECMACDGNKSGLVTLQASVAIHVHGSPSKLGSYKRTFEVKN